MSVNRVINKLGELVRFRSSSGAQLHGMCYRADANKVTIIHVHGSFGNFYANPLMSTMARIYSEGGINLLSFNNSSHDGIAEGDRNGSFEYVGGSQAKFNECVYDIEGAVTFAREFSERIVLQGHSLGCDRVISYLLNCANGCDCVLLAPCDSYQLQSNWIAPETVEEQIQRIKMEAPRDREFDWLPSREYGVRGGKDWTYCIPITRKAFLSIAEGPPFRLFKIKEPAEFYLDRKAFVYIGGQDALQVWPHDKMFSYLRERISEVQGMFVSQGDHMLGGCEEDVINEVIAWASASTKLNGLGQ